MEFFFFFYAFWVFSMELWLLISTQSVRQTCSWVVTLRGGWWQPSLGNSKYWIIYTNSQIIFTCLLVINYHCEPKIWGLVCDVDRQLEIDTYISFFLLFFFFGKISILNFKLINGENLTAWWPSNSLRCLLIKNYWMNLRERHDCLST